MASAHRLERQWYGPRRWLWALFPLHCLLLIVVWLRRRLYRAGVLHSTRLSVPVIIIGNISVGGTGKTPLTLYVVALLKRLGFKPGIVSRGYGGHAENYPFVVQENSDASACGDEPLLLKRRSEVTVVVDPDRVRGAQQLVSMGCSIIVADDGLQHYRLQRDIEIHVVDAVRQLGNGWLLPAGPLREPLSRLRSVDLRVANGAAIAVIGEHGMHLALQEAVQLGTGARKALPEFRHIDSPHIGVHAIAGIGYPERFFAQLEQQGISLQRHPFPDHHAYVAADLPWTDAPILMTEKDAVKCQHLSLANAWYVPISAHLNEQFDAALCALLKRQPA